jgi:hypothetical protein
VVAILSSCFILESEDDAKTGEKVRRRRDLFAWFHVSGCVTEHRSYRLLSAITLSNQTIVSNKEDYIVAALIKTFECTEAVTGFSYISKHD